MKKTFVIVLSTLLLLSGCSDSDDNFSDSGLFNVPLNGTCLMVNMGNYSESNGSIGLLYYGQPIDQNVFKKANGYPLRSIVESATVTDKYFLLMCGNEDKVEIIDKRTFKEVCPAITGIGLPRYATIVGNFAYVTCVNPTWNDSIGHIVKLDLTSKKTVTKIKVKGNPEGITHIGDKVYAASANGIYQIDTQNDKVESFIALKQPTVTARYFVIDADGDLWLSYSSYDENGNGTNCGVAEYTPGGDSFKRYIPLKRMNGDAYIDLAPGKQTLYYMYSSEIVGGKNPEAETRIYAVDLTEGSVMEKATCTGHGFYGFNVDPKTGNIYTANVNGFITNSMLSIYNSNGQLLQDGLMTGVGTCRFYFYQ